MVKFGDLKLKYRTYVTDVCLNGAVNAWDISLKPCTSNELRNFGNINDGPNISLWNWTDHLRSPTVHWHGREDLCSAASSPLMAESNASSKVHPCHLDDL